MGWFRMTKAAVPNGALAALSFARNVAGQYSFNSAVIMAFDVYTTDEVRAHCVVALIWIKSDKNKGWRPGCTGKIGSRTVAETDNLA